MDKRQAGLGQSSRRAGLRALPTPIDVEMYVADGRPLLEVIDELGEPRIAELDALLREVDTLRSTMRRDLSLAATAAEAGADDLAGWLLLGEGGQVRAFEERALAHLSALEASEPAGYAPAVVVPSPRRRSRMMPAAPLVAAAAALVGFLTGVVPGTGGSPITSPTTSNSALQSYAQLAQLASNGASASRISAAAQQFHADLAPLVSAAGANPAAAEKAIALLQSERAVIAGEADSPALRMVLAQADALVRRLQATLPRRPQRVVVPLPPSTQSQASPAAKSSPTAKSSPSPSASPSPKPSPSASPSPSKSSPSPSPSDGGPLPPAPQAPN